MAGRMVAEQARTQVAEGGLTCMCNLAPQCRRQHRMKTHGGWRYRVIDPGRYVWWSPAGSIYYVDGSGTLDRTPTPTGDHLAAHPCRAPD